MFTAVFTIFLFVFVPLKIAMGKDLDDAKKKEGYSDIPRRAGGLMSRAASKALDQIPQTPRSSASLSPKFRTALSIHPLHLGRGCIGGPALIQNQPWIPRTPEPKDAPR